MGQLEEPQSLPYIAESRMREIASFADPKNLAPAIEQAKDFITRWSAVRVILTANELIRKEEYPVGVIFGTALDLLGDPHGRSMLTYSQTAIECSGCFDRWKARAL